MCDQSGNIRINDFYVEYADYSHTKINLMEYIGDGNEVIIPELTNLFYAKCFSDKKIKKIILPDDFIDCDSLLGALVKSNNFETKIISNRRDLRVDKHVFPELYIDNIPIRNNIRSIGNILIKYEGNDNTYIVPDYIDRIANNAFCWNKSIRTLIVPEHVISIGKNINCNNISNLEFYGDTYISNEAIDLKCSKNFKLNIDLTKTNNIDTSMFKFCLQRRGVTNKELTFFTFFTPYPRNTKMFKELFDHFLTEENINEFLIELMNQLKICCEIKTSYMTMILHKLEKYKEYITLNDEELYLLYRLLVKSNKSAKSKINLNTVLISLFNLNVSTDEDTLVHRGDYLLLDNTIVGVDTTKDTLLVPSNFKIKEDAFSKNKLYKIRLDNGSTNIDKNWLRNAKISKSIEYFSIPSKWIYENYENYKDVEMSDSFADIIQVSNIKQEYIKSNIEFLVSIAKIDYYSAFTLCNIVDSDNYEYILKTVFSFYDQLNKDNRLSKEVSIENLLKIDIDDKFADYLKAAEFMIYTQLHLYNDDEIKLINGEKVDIKYLNYVLVTCYNNHYSHYSKDNYCEAYLDLFDNKQISKYIDFYSPLVDYWDKEEVDTTQASIIYKYSSLPLTFKILDEYLENIKWFHDDGYYRIENFYNSIIKSLSESKDKYVLSSLYNINRLPVFKIDSFLESIADVEDDLDENGELILKKYKIKLQKDFSLKIYDNQNNAINLKRNITTNKLFLLVYNRRKCINDMVNDHFKIKFKTFKSLFFNKKCYLNILKNIVFGIYDDNNLLNTFIINDIGDYTNINDEPIMINDSDYISFVDASELIDFDKNDRTYLNKWINIFNKKNLEESYSQFKYVELDKFNYDCINEYIHNNYYNMFITYDDIITNFDYRKGVFPVLIMLSFCFGNLWLECDYYGDDKWYFFKCGSLDSLNYDTKKEYPHRSVNRGLLLIESYFTKEKDLAIREYIKEHYKKEKVL